MKTRIIHGILQCYQRDLTVGEPSVRIDWKYILGPAMRVEFYHHYRSKKHKLSMRQDRQ